ncbi:hypothetical protein BGM26_00885 [Bacillus sp. FJAT-29790]|uniref:hypothetical protein n=1 Tax=Bacillus sp. FJAT-29790 TaxID=1895002 RepID=UPI001C23CA7C|nr:hypothetical protein [Bacillus sp. FJAT-29790]MBU8877542.1 hypothetical protein [Bacillus sp. FJAT-29790]
MPSLFMFNFIQHKTLNDISGEMNANRYPIQWGFKRRLNKVHLGEPLDFLKKFIEQAKVKIGRKYAMANLILCKMGYKTKSANANR